MSEISTLAHKIERLERLIDGMYREVGAREGRQLSTQVSNIEKKTDEMRSEINKLRVDTSHIRKTQEFGSKDIDDIKKALAAIYRNTDELEKFLVPEERQT
jgi:predicted  nucleic acid-binding Zn-ribbon protein